MITTFKEYLNLVESFNSKPVSWRKRPSSPFDKTYSFKIDDKDVDVNLTGNKQNKWLLIFAQ